MRVYVAKLFSDAGGLVGRYQFLAPGDAEALKALHGVSPHGRLELWCGPRRVLVARVSAAPAREPDRGAGGGSSERHCRGSTDDVGRAGVRPPTAPEH